MVRDAVTPRWRVCRKCGSRYERVKKRCPSCATKAPPPRVPKHARTLQDDSFEVYRDLNALIHGPAMPPEWSPEDCGCCGRKPTDVRNLDRDHGHDRTENSYGKPRGLACPGDWGCNKVMSRITLERARLILGYLARVDAYYRANG